MIPKISVIIPVYNAEKTLHRCIDSILAQTFSDFEVLLIDDGSKDKSGEICDEYARKDSRIKVCHKENGGVSSARNTGLSKAMGEYIIHCDADDFIEPEMLEELLTCANRKNADLVYCDFYEDRNGIVTQIPQSLEYVSAKGLIHAMLFQKAHGSSWNKLVRRKLIEEYCLKYDKSLTCYEDLFFNIQFLLRNPNAKIAYKPKAYYHYRQVENSITHGSDCDVLYQRVYELINRLSVELSKFGYDLSDLYTFKKDALRFLNWGHQYDMIKQTYPEIHERLLDELPWSCQFAFALRGYPRLGVFVNKCIKLLRIR